MQRSSVWSQIGRATLKSFYDNDLTGYLRLGEDIAKTAEWKPIIYEDLSTWITAFIHNTDRSSFLASQASVAFVSVICSIWVPEFPDQMQLLNE
jgi:hypothetical protein